MIALKFLTKRESLIFMKNEYGEILPPGCPNLYYEVSMKINRYLFASHFVNNKLVLDIGCATGYGSNLLKEKGAKKVVGIDISTKALEIARKRYQHLGLEFHKMDAQTLPFRSNSFDIVTSFEVIEHLPRHEEFVADCRRVLRNNGLFLCSTPNKAVVSPGNDRTYRSHHFHEFYSAELERLLSNHFKQVRLFGCVPFVKKEKVRDDLLYNLALRVAPHFTVGLLIAISKLFNIITLLPRLSDYKLIRVEEIKDYQRFYNPKYAPYPLENDYPTPLGLIALATNNNHVKLVY